MMKRAVAVFVFTIVASLCTLAEGHDVTLPGDVAITGSGNGLTFPDGTKQVTANPPANLVLECVSAMMIYEVDGQLDYCEDPISLIFTSSSPPGLNPTDIFDVYCEAPNPYNGLEPVSWGLRCQEGWMNTGCSEDNDSDVSIHSNGCHSDNEEYGERLWAICCRIGVRIE